jgi:hypothetical protein
MSKLVNGKILGGRGGKLHIDESIIASYLLDECINLICVHKVPLLFSLHFGTNANRDLYTVMHPALRSSFTGHILGSDSSIII